MDRGEPIPKMTSQQEVIKPQPNESVDAAENSAKPEAEPTPEKESVAEIERKDIFRPIKRGESFPGGMPILTGENKASFNKQVGMLYGGDGEAHGKWGRVSLSRDKATKIFYQPDNLLNVFALEFMRKYEGVAGLPKFEGVVPNGYQMERLKGKSLGKLINTEFDRDYDNKKSTTKEKLQRVISREQAQELLDRIAEFHKGTGRVHGDLGHFDNVVIDPEGKIRLIDCEWERIGNQTPASELQSVYEYLTEECGFSDLSLPETISSEEASANLERFMKEVIEKVEMDPVIGPKVLKYKDQKVDIKISENGEIQVKEIG